jgi:hypothetical protein
LHGDCLRQLCTALGSNHDGLAAAARMAKRSGVLRPQTARWLERLDTAFAINRHIHSVRAQVKSAELQAELCQSGRVGSAVLEPDLQSTVAGGSSLDASDDDGSRGSAWVEELPCADEYYEIVTCDASAQTETQAGQPLFVQLPRWPADEREFGLLSSAMVRAAEGAAATLLDQAPGEEENETAYLTLEDAVARYGGAPTFVTGRGKGVGGLDEAVDHFGGGRASRQHTPLSVEPGRKCKGVSAETTTGTGTTGTTGTSGTTSTRSGTSSGSNGILEELETAAAAGHSRPALAAAALSKAKLDVVSGWLGYDADPAWRNALRRYLTVAESGLRHGIALSDRMALAAMVAQHAGATPAEAGGAAPSYK